MRITITSSKNILCLLEILKVIKNLSQDVSLCFKDDEVYIQVMDNSHICLFDININRNWFDLYEVESDEVISMNVCILLKIINLYTLNTTVEMSTSEDSDRLSVILTYPSMVKEFEVPLMDIDFDYLQTGENDYGCDFEMQTKILEKHISELMMFGETMKFKCRNESLHLASTGNDGKMTIKIPETTLESLSVEDGRTVESKIDIKYISYISKLSASFRNINISFDNQFPLFITCNDQNIVLKYFVAPKFDDDGDCDSDVENSVMGNTDI
jgi:proliferating cell nuclear antigen